jgi:DNA-binding CsgD family transcriptional regulator
VPFSDAVTGVEPGVIVLHPDLTVAAITGEAERWLAHLPDHRPERGHLPAAVYAVAGRLKLIDLRDDQPGTSPSVRVPDVAGGWLLLHALRLRDAAEADIAFVIEPAHPGSLTPLLLSSWGLSRRERDVASLVLRGASTQEIATELHLSAYTVKDHIRSIFDKTGVRSRRDLVAHVLTGG